LGSRLKEPESKIQSAILEWGAWQPYVQMFRINVIGVPLKDGGYRPAANAGMADIHLTVMVEGIPVSAWLEVKAAKGKQTDNQLKFEKIVTSFGSHYYIVRSIEDVQEVVFQLRSKTWEKIKHSVPF
jgi:hypothetical protein